MDDMIEKAARAGYECSAWGHKQPWDKNPWAQEAWRKCARDMLEAMREPTEEMAVQGWLEQSVEDPKGVWKAMIGKALAT